VAHVGAGEGAASSQRCLRMINTKTEKLIIQINYTGAILAVRLNRERLVVVLETTIYIYDIANMHQLHTIDQIPPNPRGVCALACQRKESVQSNNYLAYPGSATSGEVYIYDVLNLRAVQVIEAHSSPIGCLALSPTGDRLATASQKGTVLRVFGMPSGEKLYVLRRGLQTSAQIFSMSFSEDSKLLCVSSDKPTVHVFKLEDVAEASGKQAAGMYSYFSSTLTDVASSAASMLPSTVTDIWSGQRNFAQATLPNAGVLNLCTLETIPGQGYRLLVVTFDGYLYKFKLPEAGGECPLEVTHALDRDHSLRAPSPIVTASEAPPAALDQSEAAS